MSQSLYKVPVKGDKSPDSLSCFSSFVMQSVVHVHISTTVPSLCIRHKLNEVIHPPWSINSGARQQKNQDKALRETSVAPRKSNYYSGSSK